MLEFNNSTEAAQYLNKLKFGLLDVEFASKYKFLKEDGNEIKYTPIGVKSYQSHICMIQLENSDKWGIFIETLDIQWVDGWYKDYIKNEGRVVQILTN